MATDSPGIGNMWLACTFTCSNGGDKVKREMSKSNPEIAFTWKLVVTQAHLDPPPCFLTQSSLEVFRIGVMKVILKAHSMSQAAINPFIPG